MIKCDEDYEQLKKRLIARNTARCMSYLESINEPKHIRAMVKSHFKSCREAEESLNARTLPALEQAGASDKAIEQFEFCKDLLLSDLEDYEEGSYFNR